MVPSLCAGNEDRDSCGVAAARRWRAECFIARAGLVRIAQAASAFSESILPEAIAWLTAGALTPRWRAYSDGDISDIGRLPHIGEAFRCPC